ncbi:DEAD/DEAH box helicase family protein, partial [Candidatus Woesearchaeota archaeon]|nr:DEAD/DEAH box helicase family protein [Candidatus Woesearchaeota archaeon]
MSVDEGLRELLFPYKEVRRIQDDLIKEVDNSIKFKRNLIVHAPTGLGKTAATLPMALSHAVKNGLTVFFLTSRHTQHLIALETLKDIKKKYDKEIIAVDLIGKKWMCPVPGTDELSSFEFTEYCKSMRGDNKCEFFVNSRKKSGRPTLKAEKAVIDLKKLSPCHCENLVEYCTEEKICPYEIST